MNITKLELQKALTEWDRLWRENPEEFENIAVSLLKETPETYGEEAAPFLIFLIKELRTKEVVDLSDWRTEL